MDISYFYQGIKIGLTVAIPVGPIALICIRKNLVGTFVMGLALALGIGSADAIFAILGALSVSTITHFLNQYQTIIELIGISFILYLGINALKHRTAQTIEQECSTGTLLRTYFSIFALTLTNPMSILLFAGVFAGMGTNGATASYVNLSSLTLGVFCATTLWFTSLSAVVIFFRKWFNPQHIAKINILAGIVIIAFALQRLYTMLLG